jgi:4-aminobutyrate aminotransferase
MADNPVERMQARDNEFIADALKLRFFPLDVQSGDGCCLRDSAGRDYLDLTAGWALANTGYNHPIIQRRLTEQLQRATFAGLISGVNEPALQLAEQLINLTPGDFKKKCWFGFCGSDANETVGRLLPMATGKRRLISFVGSYHGFTAASMAMSGHKAFADLPGSDHVVKVPFPYPYRPAFGEAPEETGRRVLDYLENYIFTQVCSPDTVGGIIVEALQSDGGDVLPPPDFLPGLADICQKYGIYLILDEVKIGMGRTGKMFGFEHSGVTPDVVVLGKSLGGGVPLSAVVARAELLDVAPAAALFTAVGNALSCTGGLATLEALEADQLIENAAEVGAYLQQQLNGLQAKHELIGDIRGLGMIHGVELVTDRAAKTPATAETAKVVYRAYELGLLVYYVGTFSNVLEITPPLVMTRADVDNSIAILDQAFTDVAAGKVSNDDVARYAGW